MLNIATQQTQRYVAVMYILAVACSTWKNAILKLILCLRYQRPLKDGVCLHNGRNAVAWLAMWCGVKLQNGAHAVVPTKVLTTKGLILSLRSA